MKCRNRKCHVLALRCRLLCPQNTAISQRLFINAVAALLHREDIVVTGARLTDPAPAIVIANHQSDADWLCTWVLLDERGGDVKFILKDDFKNIPFVGWGLKVR